ncbi:MAG: TapB family protein [bacterium]
MKRLTFIFITLAILSLLFIACEKEGNGGNGGGETGYYPHKDQSTWIYYDNVSQVDVTWKFNGTKTHDIVGEVQVLEITSGAQTQGTSEIYIKVTENDVTIYYDLSDDKYKWVVLKFPLSVGKEWNWVLTYEGQDTNMSAKVEKEEKINVPAGEFTCFKVTYSSEGIPVESIWFANGTGIVKDKQLYDEYDLDLKSFNEPS